MSKRSRIRGLVDRLSNSGQVPYLALGLMNTDDYVDYVVQRVGRAVVALVVAVVVVLLFSFGTNALKRHCSILVPFFIVNSVQYGLTFWAVIFAVRKPVSNRSKVGKAQLGIQPDGPASGGSAG